MRNATLIASPTPVRRLPACRALAALLLALALATPGPSRAQDAPVPHWSPDAAPPSVEGIRLGDSAARVIEVLGEPDASPLDDPNAEVRSMHYRGGALMILVGRRQGVGRILLNRPGGGRIDGVGVGDAVEQVLAALGNPTDGTGATGVWVARDWALAARVRAETRSVDKLLLFATAGGGVQPTDLPLPDWLAAPNRK